MNSIQSIERENLVRRLASASKLRQRSRTIRLATHPWKMLYPELLKVIHISYETDARTFWGGKMKVVLPEEVSTVIWRYSYFEEDVCLFLLRCLREGMTFMDIGAHFGFFTLLGSHLVGKRGRVLSFEPTPRTYGRLIRNIANCPNVEAYNCAAFNVDTEIRFHDYGLEASAFNSIFERKPTPFFANHDDIVVEARRIDGIIEEEGYKRVHLIKVDAESSEMQVLEGMTEILKTHSPSVIIEVGNSDVDGATRSEEIVTWLQKMGYSPYEISDGNCVKHEKKARYNYGNLLFVPSE